MLPCAYCGKDCQPTREHVIPRWYNDTPGDEETFSARSPLNHVKGDLIVKDVCQVCNGGPLSGLDAYGKELYERYFAFPAYEGGNVNFDYDGERLIRWLLKLSYNSARAQNADSFVLREYREVMIGSMSIPARIRCWLHLISTSWFEPETNTIRPALPHEQGHQNVEEPLWFRICQFRLPTYPAPFLVQRMVIINSFAFTLLVDRVNSDWPNSRFDQWIDAFANANPHARPITSNGEHVTITVGGDHAISSIAPLYLDYRSRYCPNEENPIITQGLRSVKNGDSIVYLHVPRDWIENGDDSLIATALHTMVSTRENASAFKQRVGIMVSGFDYDPRGLWQFPKVRSFFRHVFVQCPHIMFLSHPKGGLLKLFAACWVHEESPTVETHQQRMQNFIMRAFDGLNGLHHTIALSEEQNQEICEAAFKTLFPECGET